MQPGRSGKSQRVGSSQDEDAPSGVRAEPKLSGYPPSHFSKKREKWRTPSYFVSTFKDNPRYTFRVHVAHPPVRS